jgi:uncharacterized protein (UPF0333 family)
MIFGLLMLGVMLALVGTVVYAIIESQDKDKESKDDPETPEKISIQERLKDTQSTATAAEEYKCALCSIYAVEELSDSHRESCIEKGCSFSDTPSRPIRGRPE